MDVSIIIVNYNTLKMTNEAIESILSHTFGIDFEIILVDNASVDGSREFFENITAIRYVYSDENLGFGQGNNLGLKYASGRNVFFLNSDTLLRNNSVKILSDYLDAHSEVGACGGNLFDCDGNPTISYELYRPSIIRELNSVLNGRLFKFLKDPYFNSSGKAKEVGYVSGADFMTRKNILERCGSFSDHFFMYYEETELSDRIEKAGYKIVSVPDAEITHLQGKSMQAGDCLFNERKFVWMTDSFWTYLKLCETKLVTSFIYFIHLLGLDKDVLLSGVRGNDEVFRTCLLKKKLYKYSYNKIICR